MALQFFLNGLNVREELKQRLLGVTDFDFVVVSPSCSFVRLVRITETSVARRRVAKTASKKAIDGNHFETVTAESSTYSASNQKRRLPQNLTFNRQPPLCSVTSRGFEWSLVR